jgi:hypothetical protein
MSLDTQAKKLQEIPKEEAAGMPVGGLRKRCRVWNLATKHHQKLKERTQGYCGSRRKLAATCRKVSCCAKVAWQKRNFFKNIQTQGNCGPRKELSAGRNMTHCAAVARCKGNFVRKRLTRDNVEQETRKRRAEKRR